MRSQRIDVFGPPFIREMPRIKNLVAGGTNVHVECPYSGYPIENIAWFKDGKIRCKSIHSRVQNDYVHILVLIYRAISY